MHLRFSPSPDLFMPPPSEVGRTDGWRVFILNLSLGDMFSFPGAGKWKGNSFLMSACIGEAARGHFEIAGMLPNCFKYHPLNGSRAAAQRGKCVQTAHSCVRAPTYTPPPPPPQNQSSTPPPPP
eukprot:Hpha_TRINITY_DN15987_c1_g2::TRINITY_DN15987_c1_g2_i1::g.72266::m.72266